MGLTAAEEEALDESVAAWRQGDVTLDAGLVLCHLADLSFPHSPASIRTAGQYAADGAVIEPGPTALFDEVVGLVVLSQTCDIVQSCRQRPFLEVAPLIPVNAPTLEEVRRLKRPGFAYVPAMADRLMVADLDRTMTIEKALARGWTRIEGCRTDAERRDFALALSRKRSRFAFPDDFQEATASFQKHLAKKASKQTDEGAYIQALSEIRVRAAPSWDADEVYLTFWFIKEADPQDTETVDWPSWMNEWLKLITKQGRFRIEPPTALRLEGMTARDYCESDRLDLDRASVPRKKTA
jgi:hypothetical protein